ncbi:MAG: D-aminoacylase, partial [Acidobacteriota bacterium]
MTRLIICLLLLLSAAGVRAQKYDVIIHGGTVYDGSGGRPVKVDIAITGDKVVKIGKLNPA